MKLTVKDLRNTIKEVLAEVSGKEDQESGEFEDGQHESVARRIIANYPGRGEDFNWEKVVVRYAASQRTLTGREVDVDALLKAVKNLVDRNEDDKECKVMVKPAKDSFSYK